MDPLRSPQADATALAQLDAQCARAVESTLRSALDRHREDLAAIAPEAARMADVLEEFLVGGKLLRPRLCFWGGVAAAGDALSPAQVQALGACGAAIELVQASALLHDDVIDRSETRRGRPAVHIALAEEHRARRLDGGADRFGEAAAIVLGDLSLAWAHELIASIDGAHAEFAALCTEVMAGQHLDILHQAGGFTSPESAEDAARSVIRWKTVPYTTARPVRLGARLLGAEGETLDALTRWAEDIGIAFQLRDDLLSVVGEEERTGKPIGGDVREGKRTALLARTHAAADAPGRALLEAVVGREDASASDVARVQQLMASTGAVASIAREITQLAAGARTALAGIPGLSAAGRAGLQMLADSATDLTDLDLGALPAED
ncbi:polyprenyl synthetase family protein [Brachybacterium sp. JHP9]|uniref:Polyprenyl synthetase family protein n=1 Tax=Brachybacterium equifaecis TaxID=2910770 RepID=A0ABT0R0N3_9MICO|nr:polyprenyl synthetase family protein [Brachybacterium equifaecis]MCL6423467.1 polyprenyl synthetase family protein [Brachybacterium equifaecis]